MPGREKNLTTVVPVATCLSLLLFLGCYFSSDFMRANAIQAYQFVLSTQFLFFIAVGTVLSRKWVTGRWYDASVFIAAVAYSLIFYGKYLDIYRMAGDNICQIAYWKILFHSNLTGSTGAAFTKPGQLLILGLLYQMSLFLGPYLFKVGLSLVMGACIWSLTRVATDIGGRAAGIVAFPLAVLAFVIEFVSGSASIFLIPCIFAGIWMYYYKPELKNTGRILLVLAIQFHIHAIAVVGAIWLVTLIKRDWKELKVFSLYVSVSAALWLSVIYRVQGSLARLNSGAAAGYVAPLEGVPDNGLVYMLQVVHDGFIQQPYLRTLSALGLIGVVGALAYGYEKYLVVFSSIVVLLLNVVMLGGTFNLERYCSTFYAFGCAVGVGSTVRYARGNLLSKAKGLKYLSIVTLVVVIISIDFTNFDFGKELETGSYDDYIAGHYVVSARNLLADPLIKGTTRLMTEDDIIYSLIVMDPSRFTSLAALQHFNVLSVGDRKKVLGTIDYAWISLTDGHPYYYLSYVPEAKWQRDDFRAMIVTILRSNQSASLYGFTFIPVDRNDDRLLLKVVPETHAE